MEAYRRYNRIRFLTNIQTIAKGINQMINGEQLLEIAKANNLLYSVDNYQELKHFNFISNYINENEKNRFSF